MDQDQRTQKVAELQKFFPNQKIYPYLSHVYGHTFATLRWETNFDVTKIRKPAVVEALTDIIKLLQCAIDDMPEDKDEKKNIPEKPADYPCGSGVGPCNDCGLREECDERCKTPNTEDNTGQGPNP